VRFPHLGNGLAGDVRSAARLIRQRPGVSALIIATLAVGIGAASAVFSVFDAMLLRPLPFRDPSRLVLLWETSEDDRSSAQIVAAPNYLDWRTETRSFEGMGLWEYITLNLAAEGDPEQVAGLRATASLFSVLGVAPALGRTFTEAEEAPGNRVAVISDRIWRSHFASDPRAVGRTLRLNGGAYEVIGVMPPGFEFPRRGTGIWVPIAYTEQDRERGAHSFYVAARLRAGATVDMARAEMQQVGRSLAERYPESNRGEAATASAMSDFGLGQLRPMLIAVLGSVLFIVIIACVNIANLQLGLAISRSRELAVRLALGARFGRLVRQTLVESLSLAGLGCLLGLVLAWTLIRSADLILTPGFRALPMRGEVALGIDHRVTGFAVLLSLASALVFGLAPLVGMRQAEPQATLRAGARGSTALSTGARRALVAVEIALAVMVLSGAGLLVKSLNGLLAVNPGFDPRDVLTMQVSLPQEDTYGVPERLTFCSDLTREVASLPGVASIGAISHLPLGGGNAGRGLFMEGQPVPPPGQEAGAAFRLACPGYFRTVGIRIADGRDFAASDTGDSTLVTIVNRAMAERYWPGRSPLGQRFKLGRADSPNPWLTIVGVVESVRHLELDSPPLREFYRPYSQASWPVMTVVVKSAGAPVALERSVRQALRRVEPDLPAAPAYTFQEIIGRSIGWRETPLRLLTGFAMMGLVLAGIGVYGVLAYFVSQRTREIGVRVALGATRAGLVALVLRQSALPIGIGLALGLAGALATGRLMSGLLYEVSVGDPAVTAAIVAVVAFAGLLASWIPARRAAAVDPTIALRDE
jgi:putative ABC transport system permease protein